MHLLPILLAGLVHLHAAFADGASIVTALEKVASATATLNNTVLAWDGGFLEVVPVAVKSVSLLHVLSEATDTAKASANLTDLEALSIAFTIQGLTQDVSTTLSSLIASKPKFDHILLSPVIFVNLELQKSHTDKLSTAISSKVPTALIAAANQLAANIDALFDQALLAFAPKLKK